jgi:hypothetical protein
MRLNKKPVEKTFTVESEFGEFSITIRQARVGDKIRRDDLVSESSLVLNDKVLGTEIKQRLNPGEIRRFEVYLTMTDCNIEAEDDAGKLTPWFSFINGRLTDQASFERAYNQLPEEVADQIHTKVVEVNPQWKNRQDEEDLGE